jgi:hypothetical protein
MPVPKSIREAGSGTDVTVTATGPVLPVCPVKTSATKIYVGFPGIKSAITALAIVKSRLLAIPSAALWPR